MISTSVRQTELEQTAKELLGLMIRKGGNASGRLQELLVPEMNGFGTGKNEIALKLDDYLPLFEREAEQIINADYRLLRITPKVAGNTGVVEGELNILIPIDKDIVPVYAKFTFVFILKNGIWEGVSCHLSTPTADQDEGEALAFDAVKARNQELEKLVAEKTSDLAQKNRELQVEAALEIVRARTMAMQQSSELAEVAELLFKEVNGLGVKTWTTGFNIWSDDNNFYTDYTTNPQGGFIDPYTIDSTHHPVFAQVSDAKKRGDTFYVHYEEGELLAETYRQLSKFGEKQFRAVLDSGFQFPLQQYEHFVFGKTVSLMFITYEPVPEAHDIFKRVGKVFEQTYTRFLDLQKAEAQAREAQIEAALEKIRSQSLAMHSSGELKDVIATMFDKLDEMKVAHGTVAIQLFDFKTKDSIFWPGNTLQKVAPKVSLPFDSTMMEADTCHRDLWEAMEKKEVIFNKVYTRQQKDQWFDYVFAHNDSSVIEDQAREHIRMGETHTVCFAPEKNAALFADSWDGTCYSEDEMTVLKRVAKVFDQAYTRFLDLQKAEAQAREAQIEVSLERVRSKAMSMQHSKELGDLIGLIYQELNRLDIVFDRCFIMLFDDLGGATWWMASPDSPDGLKGYYVKHHDHKPHLAYLNGFNAQVEKWEYTVSGQEKKGWDDFLFSETDLKNFPPAAIDYMKAAKAVFLTATFNRFGCLTTGSYSPLEPTSFDILLRFAKVFEQTYTRFLDLKKAEALARDAKIETALERIRAKALAMHQSDELMEVALTLREQMGLLGQKELEASVIQFYHPKKETIHSWHVLNTPGSEKGGLSAGTFEIRQNACQLTHQFFTEFQSEKTEYSIVAEGELLWDWLEYLRTISPEVNKSIKVRKPDRAFFHFSRFSEGALLMVSSTPATVEARYLQKRASQVFELAYKRYKDLKQAEKLAQKAKLDFIRIKEEKKRTDEALKELTATQAQLIHAEKMASLGQLTAGIAHEIQNPLNFVNNFSEVSTELVEELRVGPFLKLPEGDRKEAGNILEDLNQNLFKIHHHGQRAEAIVKNMLLHSRASTGQKEHTDMNALADEYLRLAYYGLKAKDKSFACTLDTSFDPELGKVVVVPQEMGRVLLNLFNNAFYAVQQKKKLGLAGYEPKVRVSTLGQSGKAQIEVWDNGTGISESVKGKLFQPFFTTKPTGQGTGLGLSLSYDIITKGHGGELSVATVQGEWTEFTITLPYAPVPEEPTQPTAHY